MVDTPRRGRRRNLEGLRFGKLTVIRYIKELHRWHCKCDCGNVTNVLAGNLIKSGETRSCGCSHLRNNIKGQRFGKLTTIEHIGHGDWRCKCDCGNEVIRGSTGLRRGKTISCGCFRKKVRQTKRLIEITGQRFGKLTVIEYLPDLQKWRCKCDCGNETIKAGAGLRWGRVKGCGHCSGHLRYASATTTCSYCGKEFNVSGGKSPSERWEMRAVPTHESFIVIENNIEL